MIKTIPRHPLGIFEAVDRSILNDWYFRIYLDFGQFISDVAKGPAGHAEQDHNIANMSFCKILKNSIHIISMKIKSIGSIHPLTIHSFQFYEVLLTSPVLL